MSDSTPKLRLAQPESAEQIAKRLEREQIAMNRDREFALEQSLGGFRVGSVRALNAVPLTRGLESEIIYDTPANLAQMLQRDKLDAALVSVVEPLFHDRYDILDGIAVASLGEVKSVFLAHRKPLEEAEEIFCDPASLTSVTLLKVLLAERGLKPEFTPLENYADAAEQDFVLLIGDPALDFLFANPTHKIFDLGAAWTELTRLPFVYAVWAMRRDAHTSGLRCQLRDARDFGLDTIEHIIRSRTEYTEEFRQDYFGWHIHYHLGADEKRGIAKFMELLRKHGFGPVYEPKFVF
ncbi:MAG TPA: menaquinone biosynthesis protein [Verrucomicrobiae bacterium]|nr:menaquinone biosynthesis protein [Verrucomicrobiae bacterium]